MTGFRAIAAAGAILLASIGAPAGAQQGAGPEAPALTPAPDQDAPMVAVLQGLDKITARITTIDAPVGEPVRFGTLQILVKRCYKRPPEETPETTAFLEIEERRPGDPANTLFSGWMFASSPAVSALEHPVYDVWVIDCRKASSSG